MEETAHVVVREANNGSDHAFLFSTWRNALWYAEKRNPKEADQFFREASRRIAALVKKGNVRIACQHGNEDQLFGWALLVGDHLEFVYVKSDYRQQGIAKLLIRGFKTFAPPETRMGRKLVERFKQEKPLGRKEETKGAEVQA